METNWDCCTPVFVRQAVASVRRYATCVHFFTVQVSRKAPLPRPFAAEPVMSSQKMPRIRRSPHSAIRLRSPIAAALLLL